LGLFPFSNLGDSTTGIGLGISGKLLEIGLDMREKRAGLVREIPEARRFVRKTLAKAAPTAIRGGWDRVVLTLRHKWVPTSLLVYPWARSLSTSCSRELRSLTGACGGDSVRVGWSPRT
jgi:hypothetical protein